MYFVLLIVVVIIVVVVVDVEFVVDAKTWCTEPLGTSKQQTFALLLDSLQFVLLLLLLLLFFLYFYKHKVRAVLVSSYYAAPIGLCFVVGGGGDCHFALSMIFCFAKKKLRKTNKKFYLFL